MVMHISFEDEDAFRIGFSGEDSFTVGFDSVIGNDKYHGNYEFEPSPGYQRIETAGLTLAEDIIIDPIPSNYGLITWDGSTLTVS